MSDKQLVEFELEDGSSVIFETDHGFSDSEDDEYELLSEDHASTVLLKKADKPLEEVAKKIKPAAQVVLNSLRELNTPAEIGIEFGIKFSAQAGVIFASADSEASFKVSVKWNNPQK